MRCGEAPIRLSFDATNGRDTRSVFFANRELLGEECCT